MEPVSNEELNYDLENITEELADVLEVYTSLIKSLKIKIEDIEKAADSKRVKFGEFEDKIFLEWTEDANEAFDQGNLK